MSRNTRHHRYRPQVVDPDRIRIGFYEINVKRIRCINSVDDVVANWHSLEAKGFPLDEIASTLAFIETCEYIVKREFNVLKFPMHVLRMVDAIAACNSIKGFDKRCDELKLRLTRIVNNSRAIPSSTYNAIAEYHNDLLEALLSTTGEFRIAYTLGALEPSLEFTNVKGMKSPDFKIGKYDISKVETFSLAEAKSRLNRSYTGEEIGTIIENNKIINVNEQDVIRLLCRDAYTTFESAFDEQCSNVVLVNLTHSEYGDIFAAYSLSSDKKYELRDAFHSAKGMAQGVVLYTEVFTVRPRERIGIAAVSLQRKKAENMGKTLDKIDKDYHKANLVHLSYHELIDKARKLKMDSTTNEN